MAGNKSLTNNKDTTGQQKNYTICYIISITTSTPRQNTGKKAVRMKRCLVGCWKTPSYGATDRQLPYAQTVKQQANHQILRTLKSVFSKVSAIHAQIHLSLSLSLSISTAALSALNTGKTSTPQRILEIYCDSMNQTENSQLKNSWRQLYFLR